MTDCYCVLIAVAGEPTANGNVYTEEALRKIAWDDGKHWTERQEGSLCLMRSVTFEELHEDESIRDMPDEQ